MKERKIRIVQSGYGGTGSTLLVNLIHGFLTPDTKVHWDDNLDNFITKQHELNFSKLINNKKFDVYVIASERNKKYSKEYHNHSKILIVKYEEILETENNTLEKICTNIYEKFINFIPKEVHMKISKDEIIKNMLNRIQCMNKKIEEIKEKPFSYIEDYYAVHGSHRNRKSDHPGFTGN